MWQDPRCEDPRYNEDLEYKPMVIEVLNRYCRIMKFKHSYAWGRLYIQVSKETLIDFDSLLFYGTKKSKSQIITETQSWYKVYQIARRIFR